MTILPAWSRPASFPIEGVIYRSDAEAEHWLREGAWINGTAGDALRLAGRKWGDRPAIISAGRVLSFQDFDALSERLGAALLALGLRPGSRAMFQMGNEIDTTIALFACYKAGVVPVCSVPQYGQAEMLALARQSGAEAHFIYSGPDSKGCPSGLPLRAISLRDDVPALRLLIVAGAQGDIPDAPGCYGFDALISGFTLDEARARLAEVAISHRDVMKFQLSGGSTGLPKIIPRFHAEYLGHARDWAEQFAKDENAVCIWSLPMVHNGGQLWALFPTVLTGARLVLTGVDIDEIFQAIADHGVTHAMSIGPIAPRILAHPSIPRESLKTVRIFGTMNRAAALEEALGIPCANVYGLTEGMVSVSPAGAGPALRHLTNGIPATRQIELRLVRPGTDEPVPDGEAGELCFRGPSSLTGYFADLDASEKALSPDGFVRTGDLCALQPDPDGTSLVFEGRAKDNIDRGGEKFGVEDIEVLIGRHPAIADGRIVAMPDPVMGERACAFLVLKPGETAPDLAALGQFLLGFGLAKFKLPERIEVVDHQPVTGVGKLDRAALRAMIALKLAQEAV